MKCPHCLNSYHSQVAVVSLGGDKQYPGFDVLHELCPACQQRIITLLLRTSSGPDRSRLVHPRAVSRAAFSSLIVPHLFLDDYNEACLTLVDSPKASAALSRRCLQHLLREKANTTKKDLADQIDELLASHALPSHLEESLDAIRTIGNFAAHPIKSKQSGEIVPVEPHEAEWSLDLLELLFDFYFVQPAQAKAKRDALNAKLKEAGKPAMKGK